MKNTILIVFMCMYALNTSHSQHITHDVGVHFGTNTIQTDYGERGDFLSQYGNVGNSISVSHTMHFFNTNLGYYSNQKFFNRIALRSELNIAMGNKLKHFGKWVERDSYVAEQLRAMDGEISFTSIGMQFEYYLHELPDFLYNSSDIKWNPYLLAGVQYAFYQNNLTSQMGDWTRNRSLLPEKYRADGAVEIGNGTSLASTFGMGTRYNLKDGVNINIQFNWQYFFTDALDGLKPDVAENKNNEWLVSMQVGVIYNLNYGRPLRLF
ncbi:MAG: hypothetical protein JXQ93_07745 [Flavobacteriaceae bacterium]